MMVTPWARLSEEVLSHAILRFYSNSGLVPPGVPLQAIEGWSARMSFGLRKLVQRFRKVFSETPLGSKSKILADLKKQLVEAGVTAETAPEAPAEQLSAEDLEEIAPARPAFDWDKLRRKIQEVQAQKKTEKKRAETPAPSTDAANEAAPRPVASAARTHRLPPLVLAALAEKPVEAPEPFPINAKEDDLEQVACDTSKKQSTASKKKKKNGKGEKRERERKRKS